MGLKVAVDRGGWAVSSFFFFFFLYSSPSPPRQHGPSSAQSVVFRPKLRHSKELALKIEAEHESMSMSDCIEVPLLPPVVGQLRGHASPIPWQLNLFP